MNTRFALFLSAVILAFVMVAPAVARKALPAPYMIAGRVIRVADGDTLSLRDASGVKVIVRLAEIDAPERCQPFNRLSRASLIELALERLVTVEVIDTDRYGRRVGRVMLEGERETANRIQIQRGLAWVYTQYAYDKALQELEREAVHAKLGLWVDDDPTPPWLWRRQHPRGKGCPREGS
ncbi:MAG: thermonuclease family protein [Azoarcus sp.]|jgi:endonuclease YncB( thermonuclease family)|nr:thermonuclease family protein [Azoarcus sp.]